MAGVAGFAAAAGCCLCSCPTPSGIPYTQLVHSNRMNYKPPTVNKYSIARSLLKKAALIAKSIWERSKPIDSISAICAVLSAPIARPPADDPSRAGVSPPRAVLVPVPAGDGVAGTLLVVEDDV